MEWFQTAAFQIVGKVLNTLFVAYGWKAIWRARPRFGWIFTASSMYLIEVFGLGVVRLQIVVGNRPCWRHPTVMANLAKVFFTKTKERRTVEFSVATHEVICVRMESATTGIEPRFFCVVTSVEINGLRAPVILFSGYVVSALK